MFGSKHFIQVLKLSLLDLVKPICFFTRRRIGVRFGRSWKGPGTSFCFKKLDNHNVFFWQSQCVECSIWFWGWRVSSGIFSSDYSILGILEDACNQYHSWQENLPSYSLAKDHIAMYRDYIWRRQVFLHFWDHFKALLISSTIKSRTYDIGEWQHQDMEIVQQFKFNDNTWMGTIVSSTNSVCREITSSTQLRYRWPFSPW